MHRCFWQHLCCNSSTLHFAKSSIAARGDEKWRTVCLMMICLMFTGCQASNHYYAADTTWGQKMPDTLRLAKRSNPQTVDLSRLASGTGGSETIGVGDVLEVQIAAGLTEDDQSTMAARVANDGTISLPMIGVLNISGVEPQGAESLIRAEAIRRQLYHNPTVTVTVTHQMRATLSVLLRPLRVLRKMPGSTLKFAILIEPPRRNVRLLRG
jgi:hypothetical protein